ncbi:hypothetical protein PIB30_102299 [Stylosanthes scabra]|uniref:Uncharacterized protein n=1 Tax=Stylosanthes scabra TaxID=79078 RepID=A0ABU6X0B4_9FABA|nr:hypothetical protein [Stylosanthes scabra]
MGKIAKQLSTTLPKAFPSDTEVNPKGECKAINLRSGKIVQGSNQGDLDKQVDKSSQPKSLNEAHGPTRQQPTLVKGKENHIPFPQQLRKEDLISKKRNWKEEETIQLGNECSAVSKQLTSKIEGSEQLSNAGFINPRSRQVYLIVSSNTTMKWVSIPRGLKD